MIIYTSDMEIMYSCRYRVVLSSDKTVRRVTYKCVPGLLDSDVRLPSTTVCKAGEFCGYYGGLYCVQRRAARAREVG